MSVVSSDTLRVDWSQDGTFDLRESFAVLPRDRRPQDDVLGSSQSPGPSFLEPLFADGRTVVRMRLEPGQRVFGLGDKAKGTDRRGHAYEMWNTDAFGYGRDTDPLYKSIPFLLVVGEKESFGLFLDTTARAYFDIGKTNSDLMTVEVEETSHLSAYMFSGPSPKDVLRAYTRLTGRTPLPPLWALGFHMSRYGYMSEKEVREVVGRFRSGNIPLDAIWLDIDFQDGNAPFTVNTEAFPTFDTMITDFSRTGVHTVAITDPHIKSYQHAASPSGYAPYDRGILGDHFIRDGKKYYEGKVWPDLSVFPEFTLSRTRAFWGSLYEDFAARGIAGFWNDMNEPAVFNDDKTMPTSLQHRLDDSSTLSHTVIHNAYGFLNVRATYEGLTRIRPGVRPFVLTRAASAGVQRYAASWTGDNTASFDHLALSIEQLSSLGVSGFPFVGADVGGFIGCPSPELLAAWMELGAYQPFYRNHSQKESCAREPWVHGAAFEARMRRAIERRYELLPHIYTLFEQTSRDGSPIVRPLWFDYPEDEGALNDNVTFLLGSDLLIATRTEEGQKTFRLTLPPGVWIDRTTGQSYEGPRVVEISGTDDRRVREFVRAGSIIAEGPIAQHVGELEGQTLSLHVYPGEDCRGSVYSDDGTSYQYEKPDGSYRLSATCNWEADTLRIAGQAHGSHVPWWKRIELRVHFAGQSSSKAVPVTLDNGRFEVAVKRP